LELRNFAFAASERGIVTLFTQPTPRFPVMDANGVVRQKFRIWHSGADPVGITAIRRFKQHVVGAATPTAPVIEDVSAASGLAQTTIPPGPGVEVSFEFDFSAEPSVYSVTYVLEGSSADGKAARGELSVLKPPPKPTQENSHPITDPVMMSKIRKAMDLLHQDTVSQEDLGRLDREGRLN